jgi:hypothetical protein
MSEPNTNTRRRFVRASLASLGLAAVAPRALAAPDLIETLLARSPPAPSFTAPNANAAIVAAAGAGLERAGGRVAERDVVGVADFGRHSRLPRLHLVDMASGRVASLLVAHGRGSDPEHTGWLTRFSNAAGSDATSEGHYLTGEYYVGAHGRSMRLVGLDSTNCNAEPRGIVVHAAWYVGPEMVQAHGMLGRSEGCFAVSPADLPTMLTRLGPGRLLVATRL